MAHTVLFHTHNLHLDTGEIVSAEIACTPHQPLEIFIGAQTAESIKLDAQTHIALGRVDPHVHFRESPLPQREEFEEYHRNSAQSYEELCLAVRRANILYNLDMGSLAALKGGITLVGAMGNVPWGPIGTYRHMRTQQYYSARSRISIVVWPRMEPGVAPILGHEGKDFGSTFGGSGITGADRLAMYQNWQGQAVSFHNDQGRSDETLAQFKDRTQPQDYLLHHLYFDNDTVIACQKETLAIAQEAKLASLLARHIPTGSALQQLLNAEQEVDFALPLEIGLDYLYWSRDDLAKMDHSLACLNYRRPALPSKEEQEGLIALTRESVRQGKSIFIGSDHAPHPISAKHMQNGMPGSPGTRVIEHSLQYYTHLIRHHGYTWQDIDQLTAINPAKHMAQFYPFSLPVGSMSDGFMANLTIFNPDTPYQVDEIILKEQLRDPEYHSMLRDEELFGENLFTVVDGVVYDVQKSIYCING